MGIIPENLVDLLSEYNLSLVIFVWVYLISILPVYVGAFLIIHGSTRNTTFRDIFFLRFSKLDFANREVKVGAIIFLFGWLMPYVYIFIFGKGLPWYIYVLLFVVMLPGILILFRKKGSMGGLSFASRYRVEKLLLVDNQELQSKFWNIYDSSFNDKNADAPCQQSIDNFKSFKAEMEQNSVMKYVLYDGETIVGIAMITNDLSNCTWISTKYFETKFPQYYKEKKLYYFMGIAIDKKFQGSGLGKWVLEYIIDDLPKDSAMGFDHSYEANKFISLFPYLVRQRPKLKRTYLDKQVYYLVTNKK